MGDRDYPRDRLPRHAYRRVKQQETRPDPKEGEIRVGAKSSPGDVITRISELLHPESPNLNASQRVTLKAIDKAIPKAILAAEMIRDFIADVHQINELSNISIQEGNSININ